MGCYCTRTDNIKLAKALLIQVLSAKERTIEEVYAYCKNSGLTKGIIKEARKELGVISTAKDGKQFWNLPKAGESN